MLKAKKFTPILLFIFLCLIIFKDFFLNGLFPFPGNFMLAWFEPFKTENFTNGVITIAHKPLASDVFRQIYPFKILAVDMLKNGFLPLWNSYGGAGQPFLATLNIGLLDPTNLLYLILPYPLAWTILITIHFLLIGFFTYLYCRKINLGTQASILSSIGFLFSGFVIMRLIYGIYGPTLLLLPFVLYLFEDYLDNIKSKKIFILPFAIFWNIVSGQPQISLYVLTFWLFYLIFRLVINNLNIRSKINIAILPILLFCLGIGISTLQLLPTFELFKYANINRASSNFIFDTYLVPFSHTIGLIIPNFFGSDATYNFFGSGDTIESVIYLGTIPVFLSVCAFLSTKNKNNSQLRYFFLVLSIISILLSFDWSITKFIYSFSIPIISTGVPSRIFLISTFCISILAGIGLDRLGENFKRASFLFWIFIYSLILVCISLIVVYNHEAFFACPERIINCQNISIRNLFLEAGAFVIFVSIFLYIIKFKKKMIYISTSAIIIMTSLGIYNSYKFLPFSSVSSFRPENDLIKTLERKTIDARVFGLGNANITPDLETLFRFYSPDYYHPLYIKRYGELVGYIGTANSNAILPRSDINVIRDIKIPEDQKQRRDRFFTIASVKYLIYDKKEISKPEFDIIWENKNWYLVKLPALPRVYFANSYKVENKKEIILKTLFNKNFDPFSTVILEEEPFHFKQNRSSDQKISFFKDDQNIVTISAETSSDSILVLTDNYYPGWRAFIDGKGTKIYRANYAFRAIQVPKGRHLIKFVYDPYSFNTGGTISLAALLVIVLIFISQQKGKIDEN